MVLFFIDLKAAFDLVNRRKLIKTLIKTGVNEKLIRRSEEVLREF